MILEFLRRIFGREKYIKPKRVKVKDIPKEVREWATMFFDNKIYWPDGTVTEIPKEEWK